MKGCKHCQDHLPSNVKEPMVAKQLPDRPFQQIAADFAYHGGKEFLIVVDCKTDWPDIVEFGRDCSAEKLIEALRGQFCRTAVPDVLWSDGGPQFTSHKLQQFLDAWGVIHKTSSPRYPQSNGKIEATVKSMKKLISAAWSGRSVSWEKLCRSLLQYRNTPCRKDGLSPARKLYGTPVQDHLPAHRRSFAEEWQRSSVEVDKSRTRTQQESESYYNQRAHQLPDIVVGSNVALQDPTTKQWNIYGTVTAVGPHRRYFVKTQSGRVLIRNHRFLRRRVPVSIGMHHEDAAEEPNHPQPATGPRRPNRVRKRPNRLIEHLPH